MSTIKPNWITLGFGLGLVALFLGQRALAGFGAAGALTWIGLALIVAATALRGALVAASSGKLRQVERILLVCQLGALAALGIHWLGTDAGAGLLGIETDESVARWRTITQVLWPIAMATALVPLAMVELSVAQFRLNRAAAARSGSDDAVELHKVKEFGASGLTIALAMAFLMVTCNVAEQRDVRKDVSYFKTSAPGTATIAMARSLSETVTVYLFFPEVNVVADEAEAYFRQLAGESGGKVVVERTDRLTAPPSLTKELKVSTDGTIVLKRGDKSEKLTLSTDAAKARKSELRELDGKVQKSLMKVLRAKRTAYFSVGHGELNDPGSAGPNANPDPLAKVSALKTGMAGLNYEVKDWDGFGKPVPDNASILFVLAPTNPLLEEELAAIDAYLARGGSLMLALSPGQAFDLGPLNGRLGVRFDPTQVADDKERRQQRGNASDNLQIVTNQFSSHAAVTTLNRAGVRYGILVPDAGHLVETDFTTAGAEKPKRTHVVRSMSTSFPDANGNFEHDDTEKRDRYNLVTVIEDKNAKPAKPVEGQVEDGMRAIVFASGQVLTDRMFVDGRLGLNQAMVVDAVKWLGGEEQFAGETESEKDVAIERTKDQDTKWFYAVLVGAPLLVLGLGLGSQSLRRRRSHRRRS